MSSTVGARRANVGAVVLVSLVPIATSVISTRRLEDKMDSLSARVERMQGARVSERVEELEARVRAVEIAAAAKERR